MPRDEYNDDPSVRSGGHGGYDEDDDLSDLPDDIRARFVAALDARSNAFRAQYGGTVKDAVRQLKQHGFEIGDEGIRVRDRDRARQFLGLSGVEEDGHRGDREEKKVEEEPLPTVAPDPNYDPEGFNSYVQRLAAQQSESARAELQRIMPAVDRMYGKDAMDTATAHLDDYGLGDLLDMPGFERALVQGLKALNVPVDQWQDPATVARVAGVINVDLRQQSRQSNRFDDLLDEPAPRRAAGGERGQERGQERGRGREDVSPRRELERGALHSVAPSGGRVSTRTVYSDSDRMVANKLGISLSEVQALRGDPSATRYREMKAGR